MYNLKQKKICVVGLGYIGLPTALMFATNQIKVYGCDVNENVVQHINSGICHLAEPNLESIINECISSGNFVADVIPHSADAFFIAVPTPISRIGQNSIVADMSYVEHAIDSIAPFLSSGNLVVIESTCPVGSTSKIVDRLSKARPDLKFPSSNSDACDIYVAYCPERVLPGNIINELITNDRIIGGISLKCTQLATEYYKIFVKGNCISTSYKTAEMCKLAENAYRDLNIAFANELSIISDEMGIDVWELIDLANLHPRVNILRPGPGVGGHCIAVDPWFVVESAPNSSKLIRCARTVNDEKPQWVLNKLNDIILNFKRNKKHNSSRDLTIACFGATFKANVDDIRESPALKILNDIPKIHNGNVICVDPYLDSLPKHIDNKIKLMSMNDAMGLADIIIILVPHSQFSKIYNLITPDQTVLDICGLRNINTNQI